MIAINASSNSVSVLLNTGTDFSISAPPLSPSSLSPGQAATSTISLNLLNAFDNPVSLACAVTPVQAGLPTCSLSSSSVTFDPAGKASATLTVTAGSAVASLLGPHPYVQDSLPFRFIWLPVAGVALMGIGLGSRSSKKRNLLNLLASTIVVAVLIPLVACGSGSSTPPVSYAITITAMSGSTQHSTAVTLTVQ